MKKINFNKIKGYFPLTIQNANTVNNLPQKIIKVDGIVASTYQSNQVNPQQLYKPISKILQF